VPRRTDLRGIIQRNPGLKLISLLLATLLWYSITKTERDAERIIEVPIRLRKLPDNMTVMNPPTKAVSVTLRGPRTILDNLNERDTRVQLNLSTVQVGANRFDLSGATLNPDLPKSIKVIRFDPQSFTLNADKAIMKRLPVRAELAGSPGLGYAVVESTATPELVEVRGPAHLLQDLKQVTTEPIELRGAEEPIERNVLLDATDPSITFVPDAVRVRVTLQETMTEREVTKVPIQGPEGTSLNPSTVDLTVRGPQRLLHNLSLPADAARVVLDGLPADAHKAPVQVTLPDGLQLVRQSLQEVKVTVKGGKHS
jgi:YbbR domain-containing protein